MCRDRKLMSAVLIALGAGLLLGAFWSGLLPGLLGVAALAAGLLRASKRY